MDRTITAYLKGEAKDFMRRQENHSSPTLGDAETRVVLLGRSHRE